MCSDNIRINKITEAAIDIYDRTMNLGLVFEVMHSALTMHGYQKAYEEDYVYSPLYGTFIMHSALVETTSALVHGYLDGLGWEQAYLAHYGTPRHSGRYPWGSGDNPYQHNCDFLQSVKDLKCQGFTQKEIAKALGYLGDDGEGNTSLLRNAISTATTENRNFLISEANRLYSEGKGYTEIGRELGGINESTIRNLLKQDTQTRAGSKEQVKDILRAAVESKKYVDVGVNSELQIPGVSRDKMKKCLAELEDEGYSIHYIQVDQMGNPGKKTSIMVLASPETEWKEVNAHKGEIKQIEDFTKQNENLDISNLNLKRPVGISMDRIKIHYGDELIPDIYNPDGVTGSERDGIIQIRRGVPDLDLGAAVAAQCRVNVEDKYYLKGIFEYKDDMPDGVDIIFNTNKPMGTAPKDVFKPLKEKDILGEDGKPLRDANGNKITEIDWDNPFGSAIKEVGGQSTYIDIDGKEKLSAINKVNEEGDWAKWSKSVASQMLSKQAPAVAKEQLSIALKQRQDEFNDIMRCTNPEVKKSLLAEFASGCDTAAENLKAAAFPRQTTSAITPIPSLKDNEVYAPNYKDGERLILVRYPHESIAQIPELIVNNHNAEAIAVLGKNPIDIIGITKKTADKMSGADFDGDTCLVIPNNDGKLKSRPVLQGLIGFETDIYKYSDAEIKAIEDSGRQLMKKGSSLEHIEMGKASNLITDMTLARASDEEVARAIRYSMTVIDAGKHKLNYKKAFEENDISALKRKYQNGGGAATLVSRAHSETQDIPERDEFKLTRNSVDPVTGEKLYKYKGNFYTDPVTGKKKQHYLYSTPENLPKDWEGRTYIDKNGKTKQAFSKGTRMGETTDANTLSSGTRIESIYAWYANSCKAMANQARLAWLNTPSQKYNASAKQQYSKEVESLNSKLIFAKQNSPYERQAQALAGYLYKLKVAEYDEVTKEQKKKWQSQCLATARKRVSKDPTKTGKQKIDISEKEWEAIQSGAISANKLQDILNHADSDVIKAYAIPREGTSLTSSKKSFAKTLAANGYSNAEIADRLGVSATTVATIIKE